MAVQLYVDGCDVSFDPARAENVRANLAAVDGRTCVLRPGDTRSLGPAPVLDGRGCLALRAPRGPAQGLIAALRQLAAEGLTPGQAISRLLPAGGGITEGDPADWWLVPGGPLARLDALAGPRHVVEGGCRVGGD